MRKAFVLVSVVFIVVAIILYLLMPIERSETILPGEKEKDLQVEANISKRPDDGSERPLVIADPPPYVLVTRNQLEFQVTPNKRYYERKIEELQCRFAKLRRVEHQLGTSVEHGKPFVLDLRDFLPPKIEIK